MKKIIPIHPCLLVPDSVYPNMSQTDRQCHVPLTRRWFKRDHPNTSCSEGNRRQACLAHPIYARHEYRLREILALPKTKYRKKAYAAHA